MSDENQTPPQDDPPAPPAEPQIPEGYLSQDEVNNIVAREVAKERRKAKRAQPKPQEAAASAEHDIAEIVQAAVQAATTPLAERIDSMQQEQAAVKTAAEFKVAIAGLEMNDEDTSMLRTLFEHNRAAFDSAVKARRAADLPPEPKGPGPSNIPAPSPTPAADRLGNPVTWDKDTIARLQADGTFLQRIKEHRARLPGAGGGLFAPKTPKG